MKNSHWTDESSKHFRYNIAHNFVAHVESKLQKLSLSHSAFAEALGVTKSRVSRVFSNPGNLTLDTIIRWCRELEMKPAIVVYEDSAIPERNAPIHPDVFVRCWEATGCPVDLWAFETAGDEITGLQYKPYEALDTNVQPNLAAAA